MVTNKSALEELASRVEAATGPSDNLDCVIDEQFGGTPQIAPDHRWSSTPFYTASLDAAMSLVPEGWRFGLEQPGMFDGKQIEEAWCWPFESGFDPDWQNGQQGYRDAPEATHGFAATPALALTAAALRALAKEKGE